jgi:hypothetical protein
MKRAPSSRVPAAALYRLAALHRFQALIPPSALLLLAAVFGIAAFGSTGCGSLLPGARSAGPCPVALVPSEALPQGMLLRQRVRIESAEPAIGMDVIVQSREDVLTLVGFTPFGTRAFALTQRGLETEVDDVAGRILGVNPIWILDVLHRSRFIAPPPAERGARIQRWERDGEAIVHSRGAPGESEIRTYRLASSSPDPAKTDDRVLVEYSGPSRASVHVLNPWCGYDIRITTETKTEEVGP